MFIEINTSIWETRRVEIPVVIFAVRKCKSKTPRLGEKFQFFHVSVKLKKKKHNTFYRCLGSIFSLLFPRLEFFIRSEGEMYSRRTFSGGKYFTLFFFKGVKISPKAPTRRGCVLRIFPRDIFNYSFNL